MLTIVLGPVLVVIKVDEDTEGHEPPTREGHVPSGKAVRMKVGAWESNGGENTKFWAVEGRSPRTQMGWE